MRSASVVAGGVLGTLARWLVEGIFPSSPSDFPWGTLLVNVTGAFGLGLAGVILIERVARVGHMRTFLGIGLLGSYTTFSTMALQGVRLIEEDQLAFAAIYWFVTLMFGQMAGVYGMWMGRLGTPGRKEMP